MSTAACPRCRRPPFPVQNALMPTLWSLLSSQPHLPLLVQLLDRDVVEIEPEVARPEDLDAFRSPPHRRRLIADDRELGAHLVAAERAAVVGVACLGIEILDCI